MFCALNKNGEITGEDYRVSMVNYLLKTHQDELREILRFNRLSYHKSGSDNKVILQINTPRHTPCCVRLFDFSGRL